MTAALHIRSISLPTEGFEALRAESRAEQLAFLDRMEAEWESGTTRFDGKGEVLLGAYLDGALVGVCGLNKDPYQEQGNIGRLRHLFVSEAGRGHGVGSALVCAILERAKGSFDVVRLRTDPDVRGRFYERLGFRRTSEPDATHAIRIS